MKSTDDLWPPCQPTRYPGWIPDRWDSIWDTIDLPLVERATRNFFRDRTGKDKLDFSVLCEGEAIETHKIAIHIPLSFGNYQVDHKQIKFAAENAFLIVRVDNKEVADGPLVRFGGVRLAKTNFGLTEPVIPWMHIDATLDLLPRRWYKQTLPGGMVIVRLFLQGWVYRKDTAGT